MNKFNVKVLFVSFVLLCIGISTVCAEVLPVYRFYSDYFKRHFYTIDESEKDFLQNHPYISYQDTQFNVLSQPVSATVPVFRLFHSETVSHLYTIDQKEKDSLVKSQEWTDEGVAFYVFSKSQINTEPVFRLFSLEYGHLYVTTRQGKQELLNSGLFCEEGVAFYAPFNGSDLSCTPTSTTGNFTNSFGMTFVRIPAGTFMMGSPSSEPGRSYRETQHQVTLTKDYSMMTTEITQSQWKAVIGSNSSYFSSCGDNCPVENISWNDIQIFISKLNTMDSSRQYRLPTEAEWERAARGGSSTAFANGGITDIGCDYDPNLDAMGWYCGNSDDKTHTVAQKSPNAYGLYDMHGNVYELCQDWYGDYPTTTVTNPKGVSDGSFRVLRGGCWSSTARLCRSAIRYYITPVDRSYGIGFRLVAF
ncbi:MAG: formylglycine-generating enzyme family protein [Desulfobacterales bacterium]|nr:formylglycine-generating enzyme family protein [Desulfobacterales bacterium]